MRFFETTCIPWTSACFLFAVCLAFTPTPIGRASSVDTVQRTADIGPSGLRWHSDYAAAYAEAKRERRMLLINFVPDGDQGEAKQRDLDRWVEGDATLQSSLRELVLARLPDDTEIVEEPNRKRLLDHPAFQQMGGSAGIAMLDLRDPEEPFYGRVVTALPFADGKYYRWKNDHLIAALDLPPGTISQRTMVWAVRVHHEVPASTAGAQHPALAQAAADQSAYQAQLGVQGHHRWETRFHRIRSAVGANGASEVVAESWPDENLIDACIDCVASWRQSPGHWQAVRTRHRLFGYDIRRGRNGIWYGTGIFAN